MYQSQLSKTDGITITPITKDNIQKKQKEWYIAKDDQGSLQEVKTKKQLYYLKSLETAEKKLLELAINQQVIQRSEQDEILNYTNKFNSEENVTRDERRVNSQFHVKRKAEEAFSNMNGSTITNDYKRQKTNKNNSPITGQAIQLSIENAGNLYIATPIRVATQGMFSGVRLNPQNSEGMFNQLSRLFPGK